MSMSLWEGVERLVLQASRCANVLWEGVQPKITVVAAGIIALHLARRMLERDPLEGRHAASKSSQMGASCDSVHSDNQWGVTLIIAQREGDALEKADKFHHLLDEVSRFTSLHKNNLKDRSSIKLIRDVHARTLRTEKFHIPRNENVLADLVAAIVNTDNWRACAVQLEQRGSTEHGGPLRWQLYASVETLAFYVASCRSNGNSRRLMSDEMTPGSHGGTSRFKAFGGRHLS